MNPHVAVVTIVHGRHRHLLGQRWGLARQRLAPAEHVVVAMGDPAVRPLVDSSDGPPVRVVDVEVPDGRLPLAAARNAGVATARDRGADVVVLLDVDCVPEPDLVERYTEVLAPRLARRDTRPAVACGVVRYLDPETTALPFDSWSSERLRVGSVAHPARPAPPEGTVRRGHDARLFWSLSFAVTTTDWERLGGFDEGYVGYGAEDTDFGQRLEEADGILLWLGGATAYHQDHGGGGLPLDHVHDIVTNASRFARRWGWWPMRGWLDAFEDLGLVRGDGAGGYAVTPRAATVRAAVPR